MTSSKGSASYGLVTWKWFQVNINNDCSYMKIIYVHYGEVTNIRDSRSYEHCWTSSWNKTWKKFRPVRDLNPRPLRYRCSGFTIVNLTVGSFFLFTVKLFFGTFRLKNRIYNTLQYLGNLYRQSTMLLYTFNWPTSWCTRGRVAKIVLKVFTLKTCFTATCGDVQPSPEKKDKMCHCRLQYFFLR